MINHNMHAQNLQTELVFNQNHLNDTKVNLEAYVNKVSAIDSKQIKSYLGVVYFGLVSLLSLSLFL